MNTYHIGEAIKAEVEKQGLQVSDFAEKINLSRQAVYDIFKSDQISTERLMVISQVLGHDFFADLSSNYRGVNVDVLQSLTPTKGNPVRMYEDMPFIKHDKVQGVIEEFFSAPRTKPLFIFYQDRDQWINTAINAACANQLSRGSVNYLAAVHNKQDNNKRFHPDIEGFKEKMQEALMLPHQVVVIALHYSVSVYDTQLALAAEMAKNTDKWVVVISGQPLFWHYDTNKLTNEADIVFAPWKNNAFGFIADDDENSLACLIRYVYYQWDTDINMFTSRFDQTIDRTKILKETIEDGTTLLREKTDLSGGFTRLTIASPYIPPKLFNYWNNFVKEHHSYDELLEKYTFWVDLDKDGNVVNWQAFQLRVDRQPEDTRKKIMDEIYNHTKIEL